MRGEPGNPARRALARSAGSPTEPTSGPSAKLPSLSLRQLADMTSLPNPVRCRKPLPPAQIRGKHLGPGPAPGGPVCRSASCGARLLDRSSSASSRRFCRLASSVRDLPARLPAHALPARLPDGPDPAGDIERRRATGTRARKRSAAPPDRPDPITDRTLYEPVDRLWLAAPSRLIPRHQWRQVFARRLRARRHRAAAAHLRVGSVESERREPAARTRPLPAKIPTEHGFCGLRLHSPVWDVQPQQPLLPVAHTRPSPIAAWPSKTISGCMLAGTVTPSPAVTLTGRRSGQLVIDQPGSIAQLALAVAGRRGTPVAYVPGLVMRRTAGMYQGGFC